MAKFVEVDVRGLSCPEPVLLTMDAMEEHPGEMIRVLGDEAHTRNMNTRTVRRPRGQMAVLRSPFRHNGSV